MAASRYSERAGEVLFVPNLHAKPGIAKPAPANRPDSPVSGWFCGVNDASELAQLAGIIDRCFAVSPFYGMARAGGRW